MIRLSRSPLSIPRRLIGFLAAAFFINSQLFVPLSALPQSILPREQLHGILSRQPLKLPLHDAQVVLRYSPDGRNLMVQDSSSIYLLSRDPLGLRVHISAEGVYPARFSLDSQNIAVVSHALTLNREKLPAGPRLEQRELPVREGCLDVELSPGADFLACLTPDFKLLVYRLSSNELVFSESIDHSNSAFRIVYIPLDPDTAFPGPFGFRLANNWDGMAGKGLKFIAMIFSSDGQTLLVRNQWESFTVDLTTRRKTALPGWLHKRLQDSFCLQKNDNVLIGSGEKGTTPAIVSLTTGSVVANPSLKAGVVQLATNPRYALLSDVGTAGVRLFNLEENRAIDTPSNLSADVFENELAILNDRGTLFLYHLGETLPFLSADLPLDSMPILRAAAVTPSLDRIAFSLDQNSAVFQVTNGERIFTGPRFLAMTSPDQAAPFLLPKDRDDPPRAVRLALAPGQTISAWSGGKELLRSGGTVFFEYALATLVGRKSGPGQENDIAYRLRALDPSTGKELWKREFFDNSPVPFADPQGERFVLAWNAKSPGAESAAKQIPSVWESFKQAKISNLDSYFEILDARSGKLVGGVLIQRGSGPYSYDAAFSTGDALFLLKDGKRVSIYSSKDGSLRGRFVGGVPAVSAQSNLFAIEEGPGRLTIRDLATATKLDQQIFSDSIAYMHFSADGNRLLVLTRHQVAYVLDVSSVRGIPTPSPAAASH